MLHQLRNPFRVLPLRRLAALLLFPGHTPAQEARSSAEGNCSILTPISAITLQAVVRSKPEISANKETASSKGAFCFSISSSSWAIWASTKSGSPWLRQKLCQSAWCASRCKKSYFSAFFQRIAAHRGRKRAIVAVSHALLVVCYHLLQHKCHFQDLGVNYFDHPNREKLIRYFVKRLTRLGHKMTIEPCEASA